MKVILEFLQKPMRIKIMLIQAMFFSLYYKRMIKHKQFSDYADKMGTFQYETPLETIDSPVIDDVKWTAYAVKRWTGWDHLCFDQALMSKKLLNMRGLPCTLYMGVSRDDLGKLIAHAWLRCGTVYISGGNGAQYAVTGIYGDREL